MQVDQNLSNFSDIAVQTAFVVYALALVLSLVYYGRMHSIIEAMRSRTSAVAQQRELASVGASADSAVLGDVPPTASAGPDADLDADLANKRENADKLGGMTQMLLWLGIALHLAAIVLRGLATGRFPFGNLYEYVLMVTAGAMVVATIAMQRKEWRTLWPWLLTPILALMFYGSTKLYAESAPVVPALQSHWLPIHVTVVSLGASIGVVSGIASLLSVLREFQPKGNESGFFGALARPLPSAKKLDRLAYRLGVVALPTLGLGIVLGAIWAESAWGRYWGWDPKETVSFATWILYAAYLHARATSGWSLRTANIIAVVGYLAIIVNFTIVNMFFPGMHSYSGLVTP